MAGRYDLVGGAWGKVKKRYDNIGGAWTQVKKRYDKAAGVWVPSYTSGIPATFVKGKTDDSGAGTFINYTDNNNINFYGKSGSDTVHSSHVEICFTIPVDASALSQNTPILEFNGSYIYSNMPTGSATSEILLYAGTEDTGKLMGYEYINTNGFGNGQYSADVTVTRDVVTSAGYGYSTLVIWLNTKTTSDAAAEGQLTFPWSNLTWMPTGEKIILA